MLLCKKKKKKIEKIHQVPTERLWLNPKKAIFDWLLKNGFISCHFQSKVENRAFLWIFCLHEVEDDLEINHFTTNQFRNVFVFENTAIFPCVTPDAEICFD